MNPFELERQRPIVMDIHPRILKLKELFIQKYKVEPHIYEVKRVNDIFNKYKDKLNSGITEEDFLEYLERKIIHKHFSGKTEGFNVNEEEVRLWVKHRSCSYINPELRSITNLPDTLSIDIAREFYKVGKSKRKH